MNRRFSWEFGAWQCSVACSVSRSVQRKALLHVRGSSYSTSSAWSAPRSLAVVLLLGPGLVFRAARPGRRLDLGFVPLPGLALLVLTGCVAWALAAAGVAPRLVCACISFRRSSASRSECCAHGPNRSWLPRRDSRFWSSGRRWRLRSLAHSGRCSPPGEWGAGTTFRSLEVGDRSDSRLSFGVVQLVAHGASPFSAAARGYFAGYTFSARGPLPGLASSPIVLLSGGKPPAGLTGGPWSPFDVEGFQSYRLAMMTFASTAFLSAWSLTRRLAGIKAARLAILLAATTPFLVHEVWFTWPKLLAASLVILSATSLISGRPLVAGLLIGAGYLMHPLALLSVPPLCLVALWPIKGYDGLLGTDRSGRLAGIGIPRPALGPFLWVIGGLAVWLIGWRVVNLSHFGQTDFVKYLTEAGSTKALKAAEIKALGGVPPPVTFSDWLSDRLVSLGNTVVPLRLFFFSSHDQGVNPPNPALLSVLHRRISGHCPFLLPVLDGSPVRRRDRLLPAVAPEPLAGRSRVALGVHRGSVRAACAVHNLLGRREYRDAP